MRAKIIGMAVALVMAAAFSLSCLAVVSYATDQVEKLAMEAQDLVDQGWTEAAVVKMAQLASEWMRHQTFLEVTTSHDEMHAVVEQYTQARVSLERGQLVEYYKSMALLMEMLDHIRDQERVRWGNIF